MILPFSTQLNGKPSYFVERILKGLLKEYEITDRDDLIGTMNYIYDYETFLNNDKINVWQNLGNSKPKTHTIREDKTDRWKVGTKIDFFINVRQPSMFRFAPVLPVVSIQQFEIKWVELTEKYPIILIDNKRFYDGIVKLDYETNKMLQFAQNDGFDTIEDFFNYFNSDFKGKIIHWTALKY